MSGDALAVFPIQIRKLRKKKTKKKNVREIHNSTSIFTVSMMANEKAVTCSYKKLISLIYLLSLCTYDVNYMIQIVTLTRKNVDTPQESAIKFARVNCTIHFEIGEYIEFSEID